jgi:hypothetical protein
MIAPFDAPQQEVNWTYLDEVQYYHPEYLRTPLRCANVNLALCEFLANGIGIYSNLICSQPLGAQRLIRCLPYICHDYQRLIRWSPCHIFCIVLSNSSNSLLKLLTLIKSVNPHN